MIKCHGHLSKTKDFLRATFNQSQKTKSSNKISKMLRDIDPGMEVRPGKRLFIYDLGMRRISVDSSPGMASICSPTMCLLYF